MVSRLWGRGDGDKPPGGRIETVSAKLWGENVAQIFHLEVVGSASLNFELKKKQGCDKVQFQATS